MINQEQTELLLTTASQFTNTRKAWKVHSPALLECYNGLHPHGLSKLCHVLFDIITYNKRYHSLNHKNFDEYEDARIYNNLWYSLEDILRKVHPVKYRTENKDTTTDKSNLKKALRELEDMNIFYAWKYHQPYNYVFFMEEEFSIWTYYNTRACIVPNTILKMLFCAKGAINAMISFEKQAKREVSLTDIENSFGEFINGMIDKMNPEVSKKLSRWVNNSEIEKYIVILEQECLSIGKYDGLEISDDMLMRLPENIACNLSQKVKTEVTKTTKGTNMDMAELTLALVPDNGNLVKRRKPREQNKAESLSVTADIHKFKRVNPFKDCNSFIEFYRSNIRSCVNNPRFTSFGAERRIAEEILDLLLDNGHSKDIDFLKGWVRYYASKTLIGNRAMDTEKTSLTAFKETFTAFNRGYVA